MPNVMAALPNIGGALCSMLQSVADAQYWNAVLPRRETRSNLQGCPKLANRTQLLVGRSSPYYEDMWRRYCCLTTFFPIVETCLSCEDIAWQSCGMAPRRRLFGDFLRAVFSASCAQHVSDLHSKFTLRPHHVWKYGRHPIYDRWDWVRKKEESKKEEAEEETTGWKYIWPALLHRAAINDFAGSKFYCLQVLYDGN